MTGALFMAHGWKVLPQEMAQGQGSLGTPLSERLVRKWRRTGMVFSEKDLMNMSGK